jgi:hypothetical protein
MAKWTYLLALAPLVLGACSSDIGAYSISAENVVAARTLARSSEHRVSAVYSSATKPQNWTSCRGIAVGLPDEQTFDAYIAKAFKDELALGELLASDGDIKLKIDLTKLDFSSFNGTWLLGADVYANGIKLLTASGAHDHDAAFAAIQECNNAANNFELAVQNLVKSIMTNPKFMALFA